MEKKGLKGNDGKPRICRWMCLWP